MPFPTMTSILYITEGENTFEIARKKADFNGDENVSHLGRIKKFLRKESPDITIPYSATCRESTLGFIQSYMKSFLSLESYAKLYIQFYYSGIKNHEKFIDSAIHWAGYKRDSGSNHVKVVYNPDSGSMLVDMYLEYFDMAKMSMLLFCLSRFSTAPEKADDYIKLALGNPSQSFPNNSSQATFLSSMMCFAFFTREKSDNYTNYHRSLGYYSYLDGGVTGICQAMKSYAKKHPQLFIDYCDKYNINLEMVNNDFPFSDSMTWEDFKELSTLKFSVGFQNLGEW